ETICLVTAPETSAAAQSTLTPSSDLQEALRIAMEGNRQKDDVLATLAHELRNQLAPALHSIEILKRIDSDAAIAERTRTVLERQLLHMKRLVDDLLDQDR